MDTLQFAFSITKQTFAKSAVAILLFILFLSVHDPVIGQTAVYMLGGNVELTCSSSTDDDIYIWSDDSVDPGLTIYVVDERSDQAKTGSAQNEQKYDNFGINNNYPGFVNLAIGPVEIEDEGTYECRLTNVASDSVTHQFHIEVPATVIIKNGSQEVESLTVIVGESYDITCTGTGGRSRNALSLEWQPPLDGGTLLNQSNGNYYTDYMVTSTYHPKKEDRRITCQLTGYIVQDELHDLVSDSVSLIVHYKPECVLMVDVMNSDCRLVTLRCECEASPNIMEYSFFNGSSLLNITGSNTYNVITNYDTTSEFSCHAANDIGPGENSKSVEHLCEEATVTASTATTDKNDISTDPTGAPVALIASLSVCGIILIIVVIIGVIWFLKNRDEDSDNNKPDDDSVNDFGNKETPAAVYAVPDKNKKSDKPDGNGAGPESDMPTYADVNKPPQPTAAPRTSQKVSDDQPMQELQYADLDHGKQQPTNEIRKPQEEPTEYATVQSVIV